jgi:NitT/TauT family transport system substrate-binding protein
VVFILWLRPKGHWGKVERITVGTTTSEVNSLILIAKDQGYFAANGIDLTHKIYASGVAAVDGMLNQEVDMATGSEFAFAAKVLSQAGINTIGSINRSSVEYLVGRVDKGTKSIPDLKGKRIGVPLKSRPEFSLDRFLYLRGIDDSEVTLVNVPINQSVDALVSGKVDAVTAWQPYVNQIKDRMGNRAVTWPTQEQQPSYTLVMCGNKWTVKNSKLVTRFLKSLIQAESYNASHPEVAKAFIQKKLNYDEAYVAAVWPDYHFLVSLDQSLIAAMEDEARWMIKNNLTKEKKVPDFLNYIYIDGLKAVKPEAVNIIR